jgi:hypothetical protein
LEVDPHSGESRLAGPKGKKPQDVDLGAEIARLRQAPQEREQAFLRSLEHEKDKSKRMTDRFEELLKKAKTDPSQPGPRDIDL